MKEPKSFRVIFRRGNEVTIEAARAEGNLDGWLSFYDDKDDLIGGVIVTQISGWWRLPPERSTG